MRSWQYKPSPYIDKSISETLTVFPRERDMAYTLLRGMGNIFLRCFLKIYFRLAIEGKENLPREESYVIVANHSSHMDAVCLLAALPLKSLNNIFAAAAKDYFFSSFFKSLFSVVFINALPFERQKPCRQSLELCADVLSASHKILIMFPEGTRSADGQIQPFKPGIGALVAGTERLVVPAFIRGAHRAWARGSVVPRPKKITVVIGRPMDFRDFDKNKQAYLDIAKQIEDSVRELAKKEEKNA